MGHQDRIEGVAAQVRPRRRQRTAPHSHYIRKTLRQMLLHRLGQHVVRLNEEHADRAAVAAI